MEARVRREALEPLGFAARVQVELLLESGVMEAHEWMDFDEAN